MPSSSPGATMTTSERWQKGWLAGLAALLLAFPASAADKPAKDQTRRLEQQLRAAMRQKTETEAKLTEVQGKVTEAESRADAAGARSARLAKALETAKADIATGQAEKEALAAKLSETERQLAQLKNEKLRVDADLAAHKKTLGDCRTRNARMYDLGTELLGRYERKSCLDSALQAEPFTGLKRAQIEKMMEEDRERLDKEQILPSGSAATGTGS